MEALPGILDKLTSKDWRERSNGLKELEEAVIECPCLPEGQLVSMFDHLLERLNDGNIKVNVQGLNTLTKIFPALGESVCISLNTLVPALAANLGSTNEKIRSSANETMIALISSLEPSLLVANFSHCVSHGSLRTKPVMLEKLAAISSEVYTLRPHLVVKHVLPTAFTMLNETKGEIRTANNRLLSTLQDVMGPALLEHASGLSKPQIQRLQQCLNEVKSH